MVEDRRLGALTHIDAERTAELHLGRAAALYNVMFSDPSSEIELFPFVQCPRSIRTARSWNVGLLHSRPQARVRRSPPVAT
jgi:hypothetical protein